MFCVVRSMHKIALQVKTTSELEETAKLLASHSVDHKLWVRAAYRFRVPVSWT